MSHIATEDPAATSSVHVHDFTDGQPAAGSDGPSPASDAAPKVFHDFDDAEPVVDLPEAATPALDVPTWRGVRLHPFLASRQGLFAQLRLSRGAPPLQACLDDLDGFLADAYRILWLCSHEATDWSSLRCRPGEFQETIDRWADEDPPSASVEAVAVAFRIYADSRSRES